jgi:hypothetical protein
MQNPTLGSKKNQMHIYGLGKQKFIAKSVIQGPKCFTYLFNTVRVKTNFLKIEFFLMPQTKKNAPFPLLFCQYFLYPSSNGKTFLYLAKIIWRLKKLKNLLPVLQSKKASL